MTSLLLSIVIESISCWVKDTVVRKTSGTADMEGAADVFLEIVMQPFLGFDDIVPDSSSPATV